MHFLDTGDKKLEAKIKREHLLQGENEALGQRVSKAAGAPLG